MERFRKDGENYEIVLTWENDHKVLYLARAERQKRHSYMLGWSNKGEYPGWVHLKNKGSRYSLKTIMGIWNDAIKDVDRITFTKKPTK